MFTHVLQHWIFSRKMYRIRNFQQIIRVVQIHLAINLESIHCTSLLRVSAIILLLNVKMRAFVNSQILILDTFNYMSWNNNPEKTLKLFIILPKFILDMFTALRFVMNSKGGYYHVKMNSLNNQNRSCLKHQLSGFRIVYIMLMCCSFSVQVNNVD